MDAYEPVMSFDESNAAVYDELAVRGDEEAAVAFLAARRVTGRCSRWPSAPVASRCRWRRPV